ncbi:MAG TPA: hypothetical protein VG126_17360 [Thermoleophilaceae bacterium]|nr:hypothetical protein [Thermoleophilaceae bacterium]
MSEKLSAVGRASLFIVFTAMTVAIVVLALSLRDEQGPLEAESVAVELVGDGVAEESRREGDRWEVDVVRPDGSMVQVSLGEDLELRGLDEELGPAGTLAEDELRGRARARAVRAAFAETGIGRVVSVEHDAGGGIEVRVRTEGASETLEVELNRDFEVVEVEQESLGDE